MFWDTNQFLLTTTLYDSVRTTLVYNDDKYSFYLWRYNQVRLFIIY
jgi:hypothetical protein